MYGKIIVDKIDEVYLRLTVNEEQAYELKDYFSCYVPNYRFHPKVKNHIWDGKISFFDLRSQTIPIGLYTHLMEFAKKYQYELEFNIDKDDMYNDINDEDFTEMYKQIFKEGIEVRDYQDICIKKLLKFKRGVIESATGSGKSLIIYAIIRFLLSQYSDKKILLVVPNISLVNQMFTEFEGYGFTNAKDYCSILYSDSKRYDQSKPILISTWQSIYKKPPIFFKDFIGVIVDEVHNAKASSLQGILKKCLFSEYRIGMTGTLPSDTSELLTIQGYLGPKLHSIDYAELIDKGVLAKLKIANILLRYPEEFVKKNKKRSYDEEVRALLEYKDRNKVFKYILDNLNEDENILVLCHRIEHLKELVKYFNEYSLESGKNYSVFEIYGEVDPDEREDIRKSMNEKGRIILVGTYATMSTGINIRRIHHVIFASSYKSKIKVLQSIGRGLRTHETKERLFLWDIVDDLTWVKRTGNIGKNYVYQHYEERLRYYEQYGFEYLTCKIKLEKI